VSPVFDVARRLLVVDLRTGTEAARFEETLGESSVVGRASHVARLGVGVLICGAISWPLEQALASAGIEVIAHVCGNVEDVLDAYVSGRLTDGAFLMPGCRECRYRRGRTRVSPDRRPRPEGGLDGAGPRLPRLEKRTTKP
jgi:predicted Fe-Mo cluster-binding NifX family protein